MPRTRRHPLRLLFPVASLAATAVALFATPAAQAQSSCTGQSGTSALEQYCEAVPRADGSRDRPSSGKASGSGVSSSTAQTLSESGADGAAVQALAGGTSSSSDTGTSKPRTTSSSSSNVKSSTGGSAAAEGAISTGDAGAVKGVKVEGPKDPSSNPLKAATTAAQSGPVAGPTLVWGIVGLTAVGAIGAVILRRRESLTPPGNDDDV